MRRIRMMYNVRASERCKTLTSWTWRSSSENGEVCKSEESLIHQPCQIQPAVASVAVLLCGWRCEATNFNPDVGKTIGFEDRAFFLDLSTA